MICDECETVAHCMKNGCVPKTTKKDEALKLALEALEYASTGNRRPELITPAIIALRQAIDQAEQAQPVAWFRYESVYEYRNQLARCTPKCIGAFPVYTAPPPRQPLTDEQIGALLGPFPKYASEWGDGDFYQFARVIEAAHGIKGEA